MKVTCKNCGKRFDYDLYMGLCPKCSMYYREGKQYTEQNRGTSGTFLSEEEQPSQSRKQTRHTDGQQRRVEYERRKGKTTKHTGIYYMITVVLFLAIAAGAIVPVAMNRLENVSGREEMELEGDWTAKQVPVGEPFSYFAEQGDYQVVVTGAKADKRKDLAAPKHYQYIAVSYKILPPEALQEEESWSDNPSFFGIHMQPYVITKSGQYLEPLYPFQIAERMGWDDDERLAMGLSDDFQYENGILYFLVKKGDMRGLFINSFDYDGENYHETTLRESFEIVGLDKAMKDA